MATNIKADYEKILEIQEQMKQTKEKLVEKMNDILFQYLYKVNKGRGNPPPFRPNVKRRVSIFTRNILSL